VVHILVTKKITTPILFPTPNLPGFPTPEIPAPPEHPYLEQSEGSGFVWDSEGHIVTNYHVVEGASEVEVIFFNRRAVKARVIGTDPHSDMAVLKVDERKVSAKPLPLGDSDRLVVGQMVVAIGNPFGETWTMTHGIISALGRTEKSGSTPFSIPKMIQTDAPINPGNSGGPLLDISGRVIGVNTMILSPVRGSSGVGFAIPVNLVRRVVPVLIAQGKYEYAWLGISGTDLALDTAKAMDLPEDTHGALVLEVVPGSPADEAGLRGSHKVELYGKPMYVGGDVIVAVDGHPIEGMSELVTYLALKTRPGQTIDLTVIRDGKRITVPVTLGVRPEKLPVGRGEKQK
jgi:2-alkenal reductase